MQLLDKRINLDLKLEKVVGLAIGYSAWGKSSIRTRQYQLLILCFVIELQTRTTIKEKKVENSYTPHKKKKTFIAKLIASLCLASLLATITGLYEALHADTGATANALTATSAVFAAIFVVLGISYLAMDPKEKYYVG